MLVLASSREPTVALLIHATTDGCMLCRNLPITTGSKPAYFKAAMHSTGLSPEFQGMGMRENENRKV